MSSVTFSAQVTDAEDVTIPDLDIEWFGNNGIGLFGTGNSFSMPMDAAVWLPGDYSIAVVATDSLGAYTTEIFQIHIVTSYSPQVTSTSPLEGDVYRVGDLITFDASAVDVEDGVLGTTSFTWQSSLDNVIAIDDSFSMIYHILCHNIFCL